VWHAPAPPSLLRALDEGPGDDAAPKDGKAAP
jgi:hypothetical protein